MGLGIYNEKTQVYRETEIHDFRRTAITNMNAKGIAQGAGMAVSGHKTDSMYKRYGIEELSTVQNVLDTMEA